MFEQRSTNDNSTDNYNTNNDSTGKYSTDDYSTDNNSSDEDSTDNNNNSDNDSIDTDSTDTDNTDNAKAAEISEKELLLPCPVMQQPESLRFKLVCWAHPKTQRHLALHYSAPPKAVEKVDRDPRKMTGEAFRDWLRRHYHCDENQTNIWECRLFHTVGDPASEDGTVLMLVNVEVAQWEAVCFALSERLNHKFGTYLKIRKGDADNM